MGTDSTSNGHVVKSRSDRILTPLLPVVLIAAGCGHAVLRERLMVELKGLPCLSSIGRCWLKDCPSLVGVTLDDIPTLLWNGIGTDFAGGMTKTSAIKIVQTKCPKLRIPNDDDFVVVDENF